MRAPAAVRGLTERLSLTRQVALLSLVPMAVLGFVLAHVLQTQILDRTLADESQSARLIARIGIQPRISPTGLRYGLGAAGVRALDEQLRTRSVTQDLARIKIWNSRNTVVYSDQHSLIGRTLKPSDDLQLALAGRPKEAVIVNPRPHTETAGEVGLGTLVEVYVPLRFAASGPPAGAFEMYLSYRPVAGAIRRDKTMIALLVAFGLGLLWLVLYRIVARASRKLRRQAQENYRLARYDRLTRLPNRMLFTERGRAVTSRGGAEPGTAAVLVIDVDGFKQINNTLGDAIGDRVLCEVAGRLRASLGRDVLVARLGNDEFAILSERSAGAMGALHIATTVRTGLEPPIELGDVELNVEASVGIAVAGERSDTFDVLVQHAEAALARARALCSGVEVYSLERDSFDPTRLILLGQVRGALKHDEFVLHYQPKLDLESGRITGVEALLRWQHPDRGLLAPLEFVPLVEQTALIDPLTEHVVDAAVRQLVAWRELGLRIDMSVNLSARNLLDPELPVKVLELLCKHGVPAEQLTVEVTETATMTDPEKAIRVLEALRANGVRVSIDDYGTGNASIDYLARLPASEIKIDRSLITGICGDARAEAIVGSTVDLARHLELKVVAEGIETQAALARLTTLGCDTGQGYLISRPLPAEELTPLLTASLGPMPSAHTPPGRTERSRRRASAASTLRSGEKRAAATRSAP